MFKYLKEYRFYIILFIFVLIPVISIDTATRSPREYRIYDKVVVFVTSPIQTAITWTLDFTTSFVQNYIYLWNVRQNNISLLEENQKLLNTIVNLRETEEENNRLRKVLEFKEEHELKAVVARVIAKDVSTEFRAIRINRGKESGIKKNMAVVNSEGVVGRILRVTDHTADVVTVLDLLSAIDSIVKRSRARGVVKGMTDDLCELKFTLRIDDVKQGDLLISSGLGGIFPKGIPVGMVSKVNRKTWGISQNVEIRPSVDFSRLEEVLIITRKQTAPVHRTPHPKIHSTKLPNAKNQGTSG